MLELDRRVMADRDRENPPALRMVPDGRYADWEAIYRDNVTWVYRTIFARVGNQPDAEDLTAEVFFILLRETSGQGSRRPAVPMNRPCAEVFF